MNGRATFADEYGPSAGVFALHNFAPHRDFGGRGNRRRGGGGGGDGGGD
jgi:hypothetical protein